MTVGRRPRRRAALAGLSRDVGPRLFSDGPSVEAPDPHAEGHSRTTSTRRARTGPSWFPARLYACRGPQVMEQGKLAVLIGSIPRTWRVQRARRQGSVHARGHHSWPARFKRLGVTRMFVDIGSTTRSGRGARRRRKGPSSINILNRFRPELLPTRDTVVRRPGQGVTVRPARPQSGARGG